MHCRFDHGVGAIDMLVRGPVESHLAAVVLHLHISRLADPQFRVEGYGLPGVAIHHLGCAAGRWTLANQFVMSDVKAYPDVSAFHPNLDPVAFEDKGWRFERAGKPRCEVTGGRPADFNRLLGVAAAYPRTFYGLLARYTLGIPVTFQWESPEAKARQLAELASVPAGRRSIALVQIGALAEAEDEMRALAGSGTANGLTRSIMALADQSGLAALSIRLASVLFAGSGLDGALYPVPQWQPKGGFRVDRALIYALIRKESLFDPNAKSWAGARGLMQLMPGTAAFVANDKAYANTKRDKLLEPEHNLELGQTYIEILLADPSIKGDLFQLVAAWNGGPGNLQRWWRKSNHMNDPLLFIESLPAPETRAFIEQVLANYWIYRSRLGQDAPSLAALAEGRWPEYVSRDPIIQQVAENKP